MYTKLSKYERRGKLGSKLQRIPGAQIQMSVRWFTYQVLDPKIEWTAVILRGMRDNATKREIEEIFSGFGARAEQPREINQQLCTIVIVKNILDADKIMKIYRNTNLCGKINIHPFSSVFKTPDQLVDVVFHEYQKKRKMNFVQRIGKSVKIEEHESDDARSLISSVSGTVEDGEITDTDAPSSDAPQNYYILYEHPGSYMNCDGDLNMHSGVYIKTIYSMQNSINNF